MAQQPLVGQDLLIVEVPRSHYNTLGRTPLGKWSAQQTDLYLTTLKRDTQSPCGIRTHNPTSERPQTHSLDRAATGTGCNKEYKRQSYVVCPFLISVVIYVMQTHIP